MVSINLELSSLPKYRRPYKADKIGKERFQEENIEIFSELCRKSRKRVSRAFT